MTTWTDWLVVGLLLFVYWLLFVEKWTSSLLLYMP